jgi:hypothetical protein
MISLAVDVVRGSASTSTLVRALCKDHVVRVSLAPAHGLYLDMSIFEGYNRRKKKELQPLDWVTDETTPAVQRWKDFKDNVVMNCIGKEEGTQGNFITYLYFQEYVFDFKNFYRFDSNEESTASGDGATENVSMAAATSEES